MGQILFNIIGILVVVLGGAFAVTLVIDFLLLIVAPKRYGVIFHRGPKELRRPKEKQVVEIEPEVEREPIKVVEETIEPVSNMPTITPLVDLQETKELLHSEELVKEIDFEKAVQEQRMLQTKSPNAGFNSFTSNNMYSTETKPSTNTIIEDDDDEDEDEDDISDIIEEVKEEALRELELEKETPKQQPKEVEVKEVVEDDEEKTDKLVEEIVQVRKPDIAEVPRVKVVNAKLIFKTTPQQKRETEKVVERVVEVPVERVVERIVEVPVEKVVEKVVEMPVEQPTVKVVETKIEENPTDKEFNELRRIREDIFNLRLNTFKEVQNSKNNTVSKQRQQEIIELEDDIRIKLSALEALQEIKESFDTEKQALIRSHQEVTNDKLKLQQELESLEAELSSLKNSAGIVDKPYYSKEYYENRLQELLTELAEVEKDLRQNKREFYPLRRIKRTFDRDLAKLRRKEAIVAKQKLRIYGVNNIENVDSEKLRKLEENVEILTNLKDSVYRCEVVLKQNKDRYPILEKANAMLLRRVDGIKRDIESIRRAIEWYENQNNSNANDEDNN